MAQNSLPQDLIKASNTLSIIIPAKNEEKAIGDIITSIKLCLSEYNYEIVVVDDGSNDRTKDIALGANINVISHIKTMGKGVAMKTGVDNSIGDIIVFLDGDGAHNPVDIPTVITPIQQQKADLVIGSRFLPGSVVTHFPIRRWFSNIIASSAISVIISALLPAAMFINRLIFPRRSVTHRRRSPAGTKRWITDCTSGFRAITRDNWHRLPLIAQGFEIETEMIFEAAKNRIVITEVPIHCSWNSDLSHLSILRDGLKTLILVTKKLMDTTWT